MSDFELLNRVAMTKYDMAKNEPFRFYVRSLVAGLYLGMATILSYTLAVILNNVSYEVAKIAFAGSFGIGLVVIVLLGSELFTGNCFTTIIPVFHRDLKFYQILPMWGICYIGNFIGIALLMFLFIHTGSNQEALQSYLTYVITGKLQFDACQLFIKGILCNFIVCVAVFAGLKIKSESAKMIVMLIVVMSFVLPGFEHSIANMGTFSMGFFALGNSILWSGLGLHMLISTIGNIIGGSLLLGLPIYLMSKPKGH